jgi:CBS domain containing-hemolysin-like protein
MLVTIIILGVLALLLALLVGFDYRSDISHFELRRRAKHDPGYKHQLRFAAIYPGLRMLCLILGLVTVVAICCLAWAEWQFVGALIGFGVIMLAILIGRAMRRGMSELIDKRLAWFDKYFAWTEVLGRAIPVNNEPQIHSREELLHIIEKSDFMDEVDRRLIISAMNPSDKKLNDIMTPRSKIVVVKSGEAIGPKLIDELYSSGRKIFPVIGKNLDDVVGTLCLDDITAIDRGNRTPGGVMRPSLPAVDKNQSLVEVLDQMSQQAVTTMVVVDDNGKTVGIVNLDDIISVLSYKL